MAKISQASSKYIVHATIEIEGVVDRPDVVGAIFGQIEGLLGADLELRELQRSGRIGRIEVNVDSKNGKTKGTITIPSSLDKAETAIIGGALEIIERIGPCNADIKVTAIEDERASKRQLVINRAKQLLKELQTDVLPDSHELSEEVSTAVKVEDIETWGPEKLPAGPDIDEEDEIIFVEGRADVVNLLRHGFKAVVSINGTSIPESLKKLSKKKTVTLFCDGDRGGDLIIEEARETCKLAFVTKAPDGKEVEELQQKEIHQAIRSRVPAKDWKPGRKTTTRGRAPAKRAPARGRNDSRGPRRDSRGPRRDNRRDNRRDARPPRAPRTPRFSDAEKARYKDLLKDLTGTKGAYILDKKGEVLGKVPVKELGATLPNLQQVSAVVMNGKVTDDIAQAADKARVRAVVASGGDVQMRSTLLTKKDL